MTDKGRILAFPDAAAVEAEAAAWVARFDAGDVSARDQAAFQEWLNRSTLHREAIAAYGSLWAEFDALRSLTGADEAEATRQHEYRPDASTWAQKQDIDHRAADAQRLKDQIEQDRQSGQGTPQEAMGGRRPTEGNLHMEAMRASATEANMQAAAQRLDGYEKEFVDRVQERAAQPVTDYGASDYINPLDEDTQISTVPAFTAAAVSREAIRKPGDEDTGSAAAELKQEAIRAEGEAGNKKPPQPFGQSAPKLQV